VKSVRLALGGIACCATLIQGCAVAPQTQTVAARPAPDFPHAESFYPFVARLWAEEGAPVVHFCVDATGRLSAEPTVKRSSGADHLDAAALELAKAGDGHYVPAHEAGKAIAGCANFKVNFILADDPSFPTLSRRAKQLTHQLRPDYQSLQRDFDLAARPPNLDTFVSGDPQQLAQLRNFVANAAPLVEKFQAFLVEYIRSMDGLGRADDVSAAERTAFSNFWQKNRAPLEQTRVAMLDTRALLGTIKELDGYLESTRPPLWSETGPNKPNLTQRGEIDQLIARARTDYAELQAALALAKPDRQAPGLQGSDPAALRQSSPPGTLWLESVGGIGYSAASMTGVTPPRQLTGTREISDSCSYPPEANRDSAEGTTVIRLHLTEKGAVSAATVARSSGYDDLDAAATKCIANARFQPALQDGTPVGSVIRYGLKWKIDWGSPDPKKCDELKATADAKGHPASSSPSDKPTVLVCTCWEESGKAGEAQIVESSGSSRFDDGALKLAKAGATRPRPPGHPGCFAYRTQFELKN
jgi:TonB family protein